MTEKKRRSLFILLVIINFTMVLVYNFLTPYLSDDLWYDLGVMQPLSELVRAQIEDHMTWSGRDVGHFILKLAFCFPKWIFNLANSIVFAVLSVLMYLNVDRKKRYDVYAYGLTVLLLWIFGVSFDQTILWVSGACNYLWTGVIILGFITIYRKDTIISGEANNSGETTSQKNTSRTREILCNISVFLLGLLAGWGNENTSGAAIMLATIFMIDEYISYRKNSQTYTLKIWKVAGILGAVIGFLIMITAPGNKIRGAERLAEEEQTGIMAILGRLLKLNDAVERNFAVLIGIVIVAGIYLILREKKTYNIRYIFIYTGMSLITTYVLILTAIPMDRALFGAGVFLIIGCVQAVIYIPMDDIYMNTVKYSVVLIMALYLVINYLSCGADLIRILRELDERDRYVEQEKSKGHNDLIIPSLSDEWNNKYTYIYHYNDVSEDSDSYGNEIYRVYYGLDKVVGMSREQWEEDN